MVRFQCGDKVNDIGENQAILFTDYPNINITVLEKCDILMFTSASEIQNDADDKRTIGELAKEVEKKDKYTLGHNYRVCLYATALFSVICPNKNNLFISKAAQFHDVGKIYTSPEILNKPGKLTKEEHEIIKKHPVDSYNIILENNLGDEVADIARHHYERLDGSGYPDGLKGKHINIETRILSVADTFDAITSDRPYYTASDFKDAIRIIREQEKNGLDQKIVDELEKLINNGII